MSNSLIGPKLLSDIRKTIATVSGSTGADGRVPIPTRFESSGGGEGVLRLCKTTTCFSRGATTDLQVWEAINENGAEASSGVLLRDVRNIYADIGANKFVSVARHSNGRYYVIAGDLT